ncbi:MAG: protein translocase subunit SecD [Gammaproteobacteria bacterium]|nr:MAG: protein translocase subunit SecD [Gammaproteobacteria bacterium]
MNRFPVWKNVLIILVFLAGLLYALPNLFGSDPSVQVSALRGAEVNELTLSKVKARLEIENIQTKAIESGDGSLLVRFENAEQQLKAADLLKSELGDNYTVALNLAPSTPEWLRSINALPMYLGLDLRGGVHFLLEVDMAAAVGQAVERYSGDVRFSMRNAKPAVRYLSVKNSSNGLEIKFRDEETREAALKLIGKEFRALELKSKDEAGSFLLTAAIPETEIREIRRFALAQNITTLRNRVNELGVAEPVIQQQGDNRIVVQLPGVQDTARAKEILGATATLEFRMVDKEHDAAAAQAGRVPMGAKLYRERNGNPVLLKRRIIVTGDQVIDAKSGLEQQSGSAAVYITLDGVGAKKMGKTTQKNVGNPMAVVYIENKSETRIVKGQKVKVKRKVEEVINIATIRGVFSKSFQITGLDSTAEARNLALLLRAGALAAPVDIVEERTVGPSLGQDNIDQGFNSVMIGFVLVLIFMAVYYKVFGLVANIALAMNLVFLVAILSLLQATLTLPGIAGIVLTVGMAVDANVLIYERIREEVRNGMSPQASIQAGYEKAFSTIFDANVTTLIAALVLFGFGSGPVKGFAVTLSIGILTSMFTSIMGTRMFVNFIYGNRRVEKLSI